MFDRSYTYDPAGNVATITNPLLAQSQTEHFTYDHRDRLTRGWVSGDGAYAYDHSFSYDALGNLLSKGPTGGATVYSYPASGPSSVRPHAPVAVGGAGYSYDANGNLLTAGGRNYLWTYVQ